MDGDRAPYRIVVPALVEADEEAVAFQAQAAGEDRETAQQSEWSQGLSISASADESGTRPRAQDAKRRGEIVEVRLALDAMEHDYICAKPYTTEAFDLFVMPRNQASSWESRASSQKRVKIEVARVQVRSAHVANEVTGNRTPVYKVSFTHGSDHRKYTSADIDVLAVYIAPKRLWYIIPLNEVADAATLSFYPDDPESEGQYERFKERWDLLRGEG